MLLPRTLRKAFLYFALPAACIFASIFFLPRFLSHFGKSVLYSVIRRDTGLFIEANSIDFKWLGKQKLSQIKVSFPDGSKEFYADTIEIESSLIRLIMKIPPKGLMIRNWSLSVDNPTQEKTPSPAHLPPKKIFSFSNMNILSENGSITYKIHPETTLSASRVYLKKDQESFVLKAATKVNDTPGKISIDTTLAPSVQLSAEIESFPAAFLTLVTSSEIASHALKAEDLINISSSIAHSKNDNKSLTLTLTGSKSKLVLKGNLSDSFLTLEETSSSTIEINEQLATHLLQPFFPFSKSIKPSHLSLKTLKLQVPLKISELRNCTGKADFTVQSLTISPENPSLAFSLEKINVAVEKSKLSSSMKVFANSVMKDKTSKVVFSSKFSPKQGAHVFSLQHSGIPYSYLREMLSSLSPEEVPQEYTEYRLSILGSYSEGRIHAKSSLENSLVKIFLDSSGTLDSLNFEGNGHCLLPKQFLKRATFNAVDLSFSGKVQFMNTHVFFPKFHSKISAGNNEINIHAKLGREDLPISTENSALLIHGSLTDLPMGLFYPLLEGLRIQKSSFSFHSEDSKLSAKGNLKASIIDESQPESLPIRVLFPDITVSTEKDSDKTNQRLLTKDSSWTFAGEILSIPIPILCKITNLPDLSKYLGSEGSVTINGHYSPKAEDLWTISSVVKTESLSADFTAAIDQDLNFSEKTKGKIHWEVSPERYASFFEHTSCKPLCSLHRQASVQINLSKISCPKKSSGLTCFSLLQGNIEGDLSTSSMIFYDKASKDSFIINPITGNIHSSKDSDTVSYEISGSCLSSKQDSKNPSKFFIKGSLTSVLSGSNQHFSQVTKWVNIPSAFITGIFPISPSVKAQISSLAGSFINASIVHNLIQNEGPILISLDSSNLKAEIPLIMTEKALLLGNQLKAELYLNDEVNKAFLQEFNPLLSQGGARSEEPITLTVEKEGFLLPIRPYSFSEFKIESAELDLKKVYIENKGDIKELFKFLSIAEKKDAIEAWFSPIFFSVDKGNIHCKRFDALIDKKIRSALWGKTDLINNKIYMTLGLDPEVIKKYFRNTHLKTKNFFLIKIRGSISSPKADWSSAYARIGLLKNNSIGSPLISNLADKIFSSLGDSTPPQTTHPLPWEKEKTTPSRRQRLKESFNKRKIK
ncbi:hypothetical protein [Chlamydiifrater phoenicopteri]|uniref:hypothetical protein n=1 Tax=Chlamydiifrater phoenicopteri TaxID=2681469 RepID=UPI001BCCB3AC|nr:hypothetical protein [Chlamydiifrater phoenicopteri]